MKVSRKEALICTERKNKKQKFDKGQNTGQLGIVQTHQHYPTTTTHSPCPILMSMLPTTLQFLQQQQHRNKCQILQQCHRQPLCRVTCKPPLAEVLAEMAAEVAKVLSKAEAPVVAGYSEHLAHSGWPHNSKVCSNSRQVHTLNTSSMFARAQRNGIQVVQQQPVQHTNLEFKCCNSRGKSKQAS